MAQQMPLPLTISCSSKSRLVLTFLVLPFWYLLARVVPDKFQNSSKTVVCCVCEMHFITTENLAGNEQLNAIISCPPYHGTIADIRLCSQNIEISWGHFSQGDHSPGTDISLTLCGTPTHVGLTISCTYNQYTINVSEYSAKCSQ